MDSHRRERGKLASKSCTKHGVVYFEFQAVFQTLCRLKLTKHDLMPGSGIIITV